MLRRSIIALLATGFLSAGDPALAIILLGTGDPEANTTSPEGLLAGSGWTTQTASSPSATAVGPRHFVSASHLGSSLAVGSSVPFAGMRYTIVRSIQVPGTGDLQFVEVAGRLPSDRIAEIYSGTGEVGRPAVIHGIGRGRGNPVVQTLSVNSGLRGWEWGGNGGRLRWGTNLVTGTTNFLWSGPVLILHFDANAGDDEATVATGDSGGGVFILDRDGGWKLAGVTMDTESTFRLTATSPDFQAALFDRRGFFGYNAEGTLVRIPDTDPVPGASVWLTRISPVAQRLAMEVARPAGNAWPRLLSAESAVSDFREHGAYAVDPASRTIRVPVDGEQRFFQLSEGWQVSSIEADSALITLHY